MHLSQKLSQRKKKETLSHSFPPQTSGKNKRTKILILISWILLFLVVGLLLFLRFSNVLVIKKISCQIPDSTCPDYVQAELEKNRGELLFSDQIVSSLERIKSLMPSFHEYQVERQFPDTLIIHFFPAQPSYILSDEKAIHWVIDETGVVIDQQPSNQLKTIFITTEFGESLHFRSQVDQNIHKSMLVVLQKLSEYGIETRSIQIVSGDEVLLTLTDGKKVDLPLNDVEIALSKLRTVLHGVDFESLHQPIHIIDMRFKYPILKEK